MGPPLALALELALVVGRQLPQAPRPPPPPHPLAPLALALELQAPQPLVRPLPPPPGLQLPQPLPELPPPPQLPSLPLLVAPPPALLLPPLLGQLPPPLPLPLLAQLAQPGRPRSPCHFCMSFLHAFRKTVLQSLSLQAPPCSLLCLTCPGYRGLSFAVAFANTFGAPRDTIAGHNKQS